MYLTDALKKTEATLVKWQGHEETLKAISLATELANNDMPLRKAISNIGEGWVAEEAIAISVYCALKEPDAIKALLASVNHKS